MKIVHLCNYAPNASGMYNTVKDLIFEERKLNHKAELLSGVNTTEEIGNDGIIPVGTKYADEADIVCWHYAMLENYLNEPHRNIVLFLHGTPEYNFETEIYSNDSIFSLLMGLGKLKIPKRIITLWKRHKPIWEELLNTEVDYVNSWVDLDKFSVSQKEVNPKKIKIALMDYWRYTREPINLITSLLKLQKNCNEEIEVNIYGGPKQLEKAHKSLINLIEERNLGKFRGQTFNVEKDIYHNHDLILTMSSEETRVVREATSCGVPVVIGTNIKGFTNYYGDCRDTNSFCNVIYKAYEDIRDNTKLERNKNRYYAERNFNIKDSAKKLCSIFEEVIKENGTPSNPKRIKTKSKNMVNLIDETCNNIESKFNKNNPFYYVRFGDGELLLMNGHKSFTHQKNNENLQKELIESFKINEKNYLVSSAAGITNEKRMRSGLFGSFEYNEELIKIYEKYRYGLNSENYIALTYKSVFEPLWFMNFLDKYIRNKKSLFIGNKESINNKLVKDVFNFNNYVEFPDKNAYEKLDEKYEEIKEKINNNELIICAIGVTTEVLAKRLWNDGYKDKYFIDIGSIIDALMEKETRTWIKLVKNDYINNYKLAYSKKIQTSIIIPTYKQSKATNNCFNSISKYTENYKIFWIDNGSSKEELEKVKTNKLKNIQSIHYEKPIGYSKAVNIGIKKALSEDNNKYILLLNNDTIVSENWLNRLRRTLESSELDAISVLTSKNNPHSLDKIREIIPDIPKFKEKTSINEINNSLWDLNGTKVIECDKIMSFFCVLFRKETFEKIGLLDENIFAYGEDNDFCIRMTNNGLKFGISLGVYIHHDHNLTTKSMEKDWIRKQKEKSTNYLKQKYKNK